MIPLSFTARAIRYRAGVSAAVFVVGAMAMGVAALAPLYARAGSESILRDTLTNAAAQDSGIRVQTLVTPSDHTLADLRKRVAASRPRGYEPGIESIYLTGMGRTTKPNSEVVKVKTVYRQGACAHFVIDAGRCPRASGELMASSRTAQQNGWTLGSHVVIRSFNTTIQFSDFVGLDHIEARIVGLFHPQNPQDGYWFGENYFTPLLGNGDEANTIDSVFVAPETFYSLGAQVQAWHALDIGLDPHLIRLDGESTLRRQSAAFAAQVSDEQTNVTTSLPKVLHLADGESHLLKTVVLLVALQLVVLTFLVLFLIVASAAEDRGAEVALAKLRGHRLPTVLQIALAEPAILLALSAPVGLLVGRLVVGRLASTVLASHTPVEIRTPTVLAVLAAVAGGVVAAALGVSQIVRRPIAAQWQRTSSTSGGGVFVVAEVILAVAAVIGIVRLRQVGLLGGARTSSTALVVPGVIVLLAAIIASRILPAGCRALARKAGGPRSIARFLALRLVGRRAIAARLAVLLTVAVGLAAGAVDVSLIASGNRAQRAATDVGAPTVLGVEASPQLEARVRKADPDGAWAMTTALWTSFGGSINGYLLAADLRAFPAVAHWRGDFASESLASVKTKLLGTTASPITIRNGELAISATYTGTPLPLGVDVELATPSSSLTVSVGRLTNGNHLYTGNVTACTNGCRLVAIHLTKNEDQFKLVKGALTLHFIKTGSTSVPQADVEDPAGWSPIFGAEPSLDFGRTSRSQDGLRYELKAPGAEALGLRRNTIPSPLPLAVNPTQLTGGPPSIADVTGQLVEGTSVADVQVLPRARDQGTLVNLDYLGVALPHFGDYAEWQVWLGKGAPKDAVKRLTAAGVVVQSTQTTAARRHELDRSGASLGLLLFTLAAGAGALLAPAATAMAIFITARRRAFELAALTSVGVRRRALFMGCLGEQLLVLGTGMVVGLAAGFTGAQLAIGNIPEFSDTPIPSLQLSPHVLGVLVFAGAMALLVVVTAAVAAFALVRSADPAVLREAG